MENRLTASVRASVLVAALLAPGALAQPSSPQPPEESSLDSSARLEDIYIDRIELQGSTVITPADLEAMTAAYEKRNVSFEELQQLRHALSRAYVDRGYVSSGVIIPDQSVAGGVVVLQAVEGALEEIDVQGNRRLRDRAVTKRIERYVQEPLDIADLQASLEMLRDDPLVERVNAQLLPGAELGQSYLRLGITERPPLEIEVAASNDRSTSVGEDRGIVGITYRGLIGNGDVITGRFGFTDGVQDDLLSYHVPLTPRGIALDILGTDQEADIVEEPFDEIDIESRLKSLSFTASVPFRNDYASTLTGILGFEHKHSESTLLDSPFSFSPGDIDGRSQGSAFVTGVEWARRTALRGWAVRGSFQVGVDALDATINPVGPDSDFELFLGELQVVQSFAGGSRILARAVVQRAADPLLAMYKLPVGGRYSVRGYRENQFVRDNATIASFEYQIPLGLDEAARVRGKLRLGLFADYGASWDEDGSLGPSSILAASDKQQIESAGLGVLWDPIEALHLEVYWGNAFDDLGNPSDSLQDRGIHYLLNFQKAF
jgi:hemolysin activation/secretion protein